MKKLTITVVLAATLIAVVVALAAPGADARQEVCGPLDSGKIDTSGDPASVTVTAPAGKLIDGYCVKAGSTQSGAGVEYVRVDPPRKTVVISHTSGKDVSHYSVSYTETEVTTTTTEKPVTTTTTGPPTTVVDTTTTTVNETTTTVEAPTTTEVKTSSTVLERSKPAEAVEAQPSFTG